MPNSDFGFSGFSITSLIFNTFLDNFSIVGTPYLFESLTFLQSKIACASGLFFAVSINRETGCLELLSIVTSPA